MNSGHERDLGLDERRHRFIAFGLEYVYFDYHHNLIIFGHHQYLYTSASNHSSSAGCSAAGTAAGPRSQTS